MDSIKRSAKKSIPKNEIVYEAMQHLGIDKLPKSPCRIKKFSPRVEFVFCSTKCHDPCPYFTNFDYVLESCFDHDCKRDAPCKNCLEQIDKYKLLMKIVQIVHFDREKDEDIHEKRVHVHFLRKNKRTKRLIEGAEKARKIREELDDDEA